MCKTNLLQNKSLNRTYYGLFIVFEFIVSVWCNGGPRIESGRVSASRQQQLLRHGRVADC